MKISDMHLGMEIKHPQYGLGTVKTLAGQSAQIQFNSGLQTLDPEASGVAPSEAQITATGLTRSLASLIEETAAAVVAAMGVERPDAVAEELAVRWHRGKMVLHPADPTLQTKEIPLEVFFHKIVMMRNHLRVLEQKINSHDQLTDAAKVELQQYITRCYGSMTTFNVLFRHKSGQFSSKE